MPAPRPSLRPPLPPSLLPSGRRAPASVVSARGPSRALPFSPFFTLPRASSLALPIALSLALGAAIAASAAPAPATVAAQGLVRVQTQAQAQAQAQPQGRAAGAAIRGVISRQLDAFRAGDVEGAWRFASPGIRGVFGSPENFGRMVRQGYPMVWGARRHDFTTLEARDGRLRQTVVITGPDGTVHVADYFMVEAQGEWRIDGVRLRPRVGAGA